MYCVIIFALTLPNEVNFENIFNFLFFTAPNVLVMPTLNRDRHCEKLNKDVAFRIWEKQSAGYINMLAARQADELCVEKNVDKAA